MNHRNPLWLQTELSKLLSHLLEEDVTLSVEEARQIASHMHQSKGQSLIQIMFEVN